MKDLGLLLEELQDVDTQWYNLGLQLKVRPETLHTIKGQFFDHINRLLELLKVWLTTSNNTSWKTITDALRSPILGEHSLAANLESKYKVEETEVHESKH